MRIPSYDPDQGWFYVILCGIGVVGGIKKARAKTVAYNKSHHSQAINGLLGRRYATPMCSTLHAH